MQKKVLLDFGSGSGRSARIESRLGSSWEYNCFRISACKSQLRSLGKL